MVAPKGIRMVVLAIIASIIAICVDASGFSTHNLAGRKASQFEYFGPSSATFDPNAFVGLARYRSDAIQGGAPFPDYLYTCGDDHDAGESAHWTPFQIAAANYIRQRYPNWASESRDDAGAGLVAFMLGVTSHYITDINWHGLETVPSGEGIIRTMGFSDFNCTDGDLCSIAHSAADTGGEFAAAKTVDLKWYPQKSWFIPTTDLVNIYALMNITVQEAWIKECAVIFYAGSFAVSRLGDIIYDHVIASRVGSLLLEEYIDFPVGGVDDNAAWTSFMWNRFADWVVNGPPDVPPNQPHEKDNDSNNININKRRVSHRNTVAAMKKLFRSLDVTTTTTATAHSPLFTAKEVERDNNNRAVYVGLRSTSDVSVSDDQQRAHDKIVLSELGKLLINEYIADLVDSKTIDLAERAAIEKLLSQRIDQLLSTNFDEVSIASEAVVTADKSDVQSVPIGSGSAAHEYFGSSIVAADFSGDNNGRSCDLLVGSFGSGRTGAPQEGTAQILFGAACDVNFNATSPSNYPKLSFRGGMNTASVPSYE